MKISNVFMKTVLILSLAATMLVGCQGKQEKPSSTTDSSQIGKGESKEAVEIEFFQQKVEAVDTYNVIIEKFEEQNPNIKVIQNNIPDASSVLMTRVASGDTPDVFSDYPNSAEFKIRATEGFLYDFTGQAFLDHVKDGILETIESDGGNYSLPLSVNTIGIYYNTRIFKDLGLEVPKDYEAFKVVIETLKSSGHTPLALGDKESWTIGIAMNQMSGTEFENAAQFYASLEDGSGDATQSAELRTIAERTLELRDYGPDDALAIGYGDMINLFANEKAAMMIQGIWTMPEIKKANPNLEFSMFPIPSTKAEDQKVIFGIDAAISMSAETKYPEESLKFIEFLAQPENAQLFADMDKSPSTIKGVELGIEEFAALTALLDAGKSFQWHHFLWAPGMEGQFNDIAQELVVKKDVDAYLEFMNSVFLDSKQ